MTRSGLGVVLLTCAVGAAGCARVGRGPVARWLHGDDACEPVCTSPVRLSRDISLDYDELEPSISSPGMYYEGDLESAPFESLPLETVPNAVTTGVYSEGEFYSGGESFGGYPQGEMMVDDHGDIIVEGDREALLSLFGKRSGPASGVDAESAGYRSGESE